MPEGDDRAEENGAGVVGEMCEMGYRCEQLDQAGRDGAVGRRHPPIFLLALLAVGALLIQGYHLGVDDAEIYIPAIKRVAHPALFSFNSEFFMTHARFSLFSELVGYSARLTQLPADLVVFVCHFAGIVLLLLASWRLLDACFVNASARWAGVALIAALLSVPVAGTALFITDPYVTARTLSTPATLFAVACYVSGQRRRAFAWLLFTALIHPQMAVYGACLLICLALKRFWFRAAESASVLGLLALFPLLWSFEPASGAAREALVARTYFFIFQWKWYEWLGAILPLALLWWFSSAKIRGATPQFRIVARTLVPFGVAFTVTAIILNSAARLENFTRLQPMRSFHILYVVFFLLLGGLLGEYLLARRVWRWLALFLPLAASMWYLQQSSFSHSPHIEWPGASSANPWTSAFLWIRYNTPQDAVFALDPDYMGIPEDDQHGFRAVAERSSLADRLKDSGVVSLFPQLAEDWDSQVTAQAGLDHFQSADFERLSRLYPVTWVVVRAPAVPGSDCPYQNQSLSVCRIR